MLGDRCCFGDGRTQERAGEKAKGAGWDLAGEAGWGLVSPVEAPVGREMERRSLADSFKGPLASGRRTDCEPSEGQGCVRCPAQGSPLRRKALERGGKGGNQEGDGRKGERDEEVTMAGAAGRAQGDSCL